MSENGRIGKSMEKQREQREMKKKFPSPMHGSLKGIIR